LAPCADSAAISPRPRPPRPDRTGPDRTLIFIDGQYVRPIGTAQDRMTLQLAKEAWHRYSAA
jgi:hypothetical protein